MITKHDLRVKPYSDATDTTVAVRFSLFPEDLQGIKIDILEEPRAWRKRWKGDTDYESDIADNVIEGMKELAVHYYRLGFQNGLHKEIY
ncbi:MAG: hypothetical protein LBF77_03715 [Spirochaetaceae bacterium]|jgi:hypothetical protein|nr:hypothetical protein [Spirochaetaceae bacterium]